MVDADLPRISIVTISFNQARFLERALKSVINQDYPKVEYIVVDPGSTDGSREIIDRYESRITKKIYEQDRGPVDGLNKGFAQATGDIFGFLNSDDLLFPGCFRRVAETFLLYPNTDVVVGNGYFIDSQGYVLRRFYSDVITPWRYAHGGSYQMQQSTFFRREAFISAGGFNPEAKIWWDGELFLDMALNNANFRLHDEFWSAMTLHEESLSGQEHLDLQTERAAKHNVLVRQTRERLYQKAMGRPVNQLTKYMMIWARIYRLLLRPYAAFTRLIEKLGFRLDRARLGSVWD